MTKPAMSDLSRFAETDDKIDHAEFAKVFPDGIPMWAIDLTYRATPGTTCGEVRRMINAELDRRGKPAMSDLIERLEKVGSSWIAEPENYSYGDLVRQAAAALRSAAEREARLVEAVPSEGAVAALASYRQADADGVMVLVSRQAIDECLPLLREALAAAKGENHDAG